MSCCGGAHETCNAHFLFHGTAVSGEQQKEVQRVHNVLQDYMEARANSKGVEEAKADLLKLNIAPEYAVKPSPSAPYQAVLLSITKLYWTATTLSLSSSEKTELAGRLSGVPSFDGVKLFSGKEVENEELDSAKKLEGIMRAGALLLPKIVNNEVLAMWTELADVAGSTWEFE